MSPSFASSEVAAARFAAAGAEVEVRACPRREEDEMSRKRLLAFAMSTCFMVACGRDETPSGPNEPPTSCTPPPGGSAPVLTTQPDTVATVGDTLFLTAIATDADADTVRYQAVVELRTLDWRTWQFPQVYMDSLSGDFWFFAVARDAPSRRFWFVADDGHCAQGRTEFLVRVVSRSD
jgi:hypothetical protein